MLDSDLTCAGDGLTVTHPGETPRSRGPRDAGFGLRNGHHGVRGDDRGARRDTRGFGSAINSDGPDALSVHDMLVDHNGGGITCMYTPECSVVDSTFRFNRDGAAINLHAPDHGGLGLVEAVAGTTDGGGNRARHNGDPAQCVGVSCK